MKGPRRIEKRYEEERGEVDSQMIHFKVERPSLSNLTHPLHFQKIQVKPSNMQGLSQDHTGNAGQS